MLGKFWVKGPSGLSKSNERWSLVPKIQVAPGVEPPSLSPPLFPPTPESQLGCDRTDQSLWLHLGLRRVGQTGHQPLLCGLREPPCVPARWVPSAVGPTCTNRSACPLHPLLQAPRTCHVL